MENVITNIGVKIQRIGRENREKPLLPQYATPGSAGLDLCAYIDEDVVVNSGETVKIPTGLVIELPGPDVVALICARSGLAAKHGIGLTNGVGVIDSDYRGEMHILLVNQGTESFCIHDGDRIAQMLFVPVYIAQLTEAEELGETKRGTGGFGSTGV